MRTFARVVEDYLGDLRRIRVSGRATGERSGYGPLAHLLNEIGGGLRAEVFSVGELAVQGSASQPEVALDGLRDVAFVAGGDSFGRRDTGPGGGHWVVPWAGGLSRIRPSVDRWGLWMTPWSLTAASSWTSPGLPNICLTSLATSAWPPIRKLQLGLPKESSNASLIWFYVGKLNSSSLALLSTISLALHAQCPTFAGLVQRTQRSRPDRSRSATMTLEQPWRRLGWQALN